MTGLKLFVVVYHLGQIGGSIGPVPYGMAECRDRIVSLQRDIDDQALPMLLRCEFHRERPRLSDGSAGEVLQ